MSNFSLYEITSAFPAIIENEEISEEEKNKLILELNDLLAKKSSNIIAYIENLKMRISAKKEQEKRLAESRKSDERTLESFTNYVKDCMEQNQIPKIETELGNLSIAKNPISVEIINEELVPQEYKTIVMETKVDKKQILADFKSTGEIIPGTQINTNKTSLRVK